MLYRNHGLLILWPEKLRKLLTAFKHGNNRWHMNQNIVCEGEVGDDDVAVP
jgi:hypothetical protein